MAATLTDTGELTYASFPIEKMETDENGDLVIFGKISDAGLDSDLQIVDPSWMSGAAKRWLSTGGNLRVNHNPQRDPAGIGLEVSTDEGGATWTRGLVVEPVAKQLVSKGALRSFSVGIARPTIQRDIAAKGGRITDGELVEVSLVDRPANARCTFQLVKSADDGTPEYVGKVFGADDEIAKALNADLTKAGTSDTWTETSADMSGFQMPADLDITFTPNDMARLMQAKVVEKHYAGLAAKAAAEPDAEKRDVNTAERRSLASEGNALPDGSYPIKNASDLHNAAVLARSGHGDVAAARRLIARRAGELGVQNPLDESDAEKGSNEGEARFSSADLEKRAHDALQGQVERNERAAAKEADPDLTKSCSACSGGSCDGPGCSCGGCTGSKCACGSTQKAEEPAQPVKKAKKKPKGPKKLPPWLNKPDDDEGSDDGKGSSGACKSVADHLWTGVEGTSEIICSKCHTTPAEAAGLSGTHDMTCAPVPELLESPPVASTKSSPTPQSASGAGEAPPMQPVPAHREPDGALNDPMEADMKASDGDHETPTRLEAGMMKSSPEVAAILRFRAAGIDAELGRVHDLTCPAYHPEDVAKCHPFADFRSVIDVDAFQRKAVEAACGPSLDRAKSLHLAWQAAAVLKQADPGELNDYRLAAHKAFRDANPGPSSAPTPGMMTPGKYNRPLITDGHESSSTGHDGPNSSPQVATTAPNAHSFDRPPLSAGHQSPSPSFMKASFEYPHEQGRPVQLDYAVMEKERARHALMQMHEHLSRQFPEVCPMDLDAPPVQPESRGVPPTAGIGKGAQPSRLDPDTGEAYKPQELPEAAKAAPPVAAVLKAPAEGDLVDDAVYKGFKKQRKKLGKKVLAGKMTVDEARAKMGRQFAQKSSDEEEPVQKSAAPEPSQSERAIYQGPDLPGLIKAAVKEALHVETVPLEAATIEAFDPSPAIEAAVTKAVTPLLEKIQAQDTKLAETQRVIDAIADQPDPSTAAFSGLAFNPLRTTKSRRPAGVVDQADIAERTQQMVMRTLQDKYNSSSDPHEREAYYTTLAKMRGYSEP